MSQSLSLPSDRRVTKLIALMPKSTPSLLILAGAGLGLAALFLNWTGDGRGIDYIRPGMRFQQGYQLPLPLTLLAIGAVMGVGISLFIGFWGLFNPRLGRPIVRWSGGIAGLTVASLPIAAHYGYEFWNNYIEYGIGVFRSEDWGTGLWLALAGGVVALAGVALSKIVDKRPRAGPPGHLAALVLMGAVLVSCGQAQSFHTPAQTSPGSETGWRAVGPEGINVTSLAVSPDFPNDRTIFMGLQGWDLGVFRSTDGGESWEEVYEGLRGTIAPWVAVSPTYASDRTLFAGRGNGGVYRSNDGGDSWRKASRGFPRFEDIGECCGYYPAFSLEFSPAYATDRTVYLGSSDGVFRSTDGGDTWQGVVEGLSDTWIIAITLSPSFVSDNTLFVVAQDPNWDSGSSLFISTNRGDTWRPITANLGPLGRLPRWIGSSGHKWIMSGLSVSPSYAEDGSLYAATLDGLLKSSDRGQTWKEVFSYDWQGNFEPWVVVSPTYATDGTVYTSKVCGGVFRSTDRGATWQDVSEDFNVPTAALSSAPRGCNPPGIRFLLFSPSSAEDRDLLVWTEVGIFQQLDP